MRDFFLNELLLVSFQARRARRVSFDPDVNVIRGPNETGKSSLIKSILRAFGAEPAKVSERWRKADVYSLVRFEVNGQQFALLRHGDLFAAFDSKGVLVGRFKSVTNELAPFLSTLFDFGLRLQNRDGQMVPLPPAYYFLPFYMDQDVSWVHSWAAFASLQQFPNWRNALIQYHTGIRGNAYYEAQGRKLEAEAVHADMTRRREGLEGVASDLSKRFTPGQFNIDLTAYEQEIAELLTQCEHLRRREEQFKSEITDLTNQRHSLHAQLEIAKRARLESRKDYDFASGHAEDQLECPTCGATYENSFAERFAIAVDEDRCEHLALQLTEELEEIDGQRNKLVAGFREVSSELSRIGELLATKQGEVTLANLIQQEGRRELRITVDDQIENMRGEEYNAATTIVSFEDQMKRLDSRERRIEVNGFYEDRMQTFLHELDVRTLSIRAQRRVDAAVKVTGSEGPRALLAYQMAILYTIERFGSAAFAPIIVDSPNQQDQDDPHQERILRFLGERRPSGRQLILGMVDPGPTVLGGQEIVLERKYSLLDESQFAGVSEELDSYVDAALAE